MLVLKKISGKKFTIYLGILILMLGGTGYMLYVNNSLSRPRPLTIDNPAQFNLPAPVANQTAQIPAEENSIEKTDNISLEPSENKSGSKLDLSIFSSRKYKELRQNIIIPGEQASIGKRNPFLPN